MSFHSLQKKIWVKSAASDGFTLIELLVVMLILGILAAIALPAFFNQKGKAADAKAKEYAHTAQVAMETCATNNSGSYETCDLTKLEAIEPTLKGVGVTVAEKAAKKYKITAASTPSTQTFSVERLESGELKFPCTEKKVGGCPEVSGAGSWAGG